MLQLFLKHCSCTGIGLQSPMIPLTLLLNLPDVTELLFFVCLPILSDLKRFCPITSQNHINNFDLQIASKRVGTLASLKILMCWVGQKAQEETQYWNVWYVQTKTTLDKIT